MKNAQTQSLPAGAVTAQYDFFNATRDGKNLFSVNAGVPLSDAFDQLSMLLSASESAIEGLDENPTDGPCARWAAAHTMNFAYALVQAMHAGFNAHTRGEA